MEREWSDLFTTPPGAKWRLVDLMPQRSQGSVVLAPKKQRIRPAEREWSDLFTTPLGAKWVAGGSGAAKESGACGSGPPNKQRVHPEEQECSDLFTMPPGAKWQLAALVPQRSLGLMVLGPSTSRAGESYFGTLARGGTLFPRLPSHWAHTLKMTII
ncbi:hypothetical protein NDU88_009916 [Pleurodeles waltl]|uniref:Uncharacterized protein n=1 Tax=Pleurodeles waltl TaxID=8319 RepID=A0AAV7QUE3_PLEWA|nr:hypothetical protein NDU88_009916 [Pleurodeles waltl]